MHGGPHTVSDVMTHNVVAVSRDAPFNTGKTDDPSLTPVAARLVRAVEGMVDVVCALVTGPYTVKDADV